MTKQDFVACFLFGSFSFYSAFLINEWFKSVFGSFEITDQIIYALPIQRTLFALNTLL